MKSDTSLNGDNFRQVCRHLLEGTTEIPKRCLLNHECRHCGFDQWLEETGETQGGPPYISLPACKTPAAWRHAPRKPLQEDKTAGALQQSGQTARSEMICCQLTGGG